MIDESYSIVYSTDGHVPVGLSFILEDFMEISSTNALTGVGKNVPVLEDQEVTPVANVGVPGAKTIAHDMDQRVAERLRTDVDRQMGIGAVLDIRA